MAAGDITLTAAVTTSVPGFTVARLDINLAGGLMNVQFLDALGGVHQATLTDASCVGFGISGGVITDGIARAITGEYTKLIGILFGSATGNANARRSAAIQALVTDGVITVTGTVG
jgi:hypothetical protein